MTSICRSMPNSRTNDSSARPGMKAMTDSISPAKRYSAAAILLHWTIAALLVFQLALGWRLSAIHPGIGRFAAYQLHKSVGITILLLSLVRIVVRLLVRRPAPVAGPRSFPTSRSPARPPASPRRQRPGAHRRARMRRGAHRAEAAVRRPSAIRPDWSDRTGTCPGDLPMP